MRGGESGVSPMIGTVLVLGISVAGTAIALLFGAPVLQRLQDQAAVDAMVGQFGSVREATQAMTTVGDGRTIGISMPRGDLLLEPGTRWMVTFNQDGANPACDFQILNWADGDDEVHLSLGAGADCRGLVGNPAIECLLNELPILQAGAACVEVFRVEGPDETEIPVDGWSAQGGGGFDITRLTLDEDLLANRTYVFRFTDLEDEVYSEAWILPTDRLHWRGGPVAAEFEAGAVVAHGRAGDHLASPPRIDEGPGPAGPALLVLPALRIDHGAQVSGSGTHGLALELNASYVRHQGEAYLVRIDLAGDNAVPFCAGFLVRNDVSPVPWAADAPDGECATAGDQATVPVTKDDTVSLVFDPPNGGDPAFVLTYMVYDVRLQP